MSELKMMAARIDEGVTEDVAVVEYGLFTDLLMTALPVFLRLFSSCPPKPTPPEPPHPDPAPTDAARQAWSLAWGLKSRATEGYDETAHEYGPRLLRTMAKQVRKDKKKNGEPITRAEALEIAHEALEEARIQSMKTLAACVAEALPLAKAEETTETEE